MSSRSISDLVGELATDEDVLDASDRMDSSLILVCNGSSGCILPCSVALRTSWRGSGLQTIAPTDLEKGDSSIGVTLMRDEGESNDCARIRTLGDGVLGGAIRVAIL